MRGFLENEEVKPCIGPLQPTVARGLRCNFRGFFVRTRNPQETVQISVPVSRMEKLVFSYVIAPNAEKEYTFVEVQCSIFVGE